MPCMYSETPTNDVTDSVTDNSPAVTSNTGANYTRFSYADGSEVSQDPGHHDSDELTILYIANSRGPIELAMIFGGDSNQHTDCVLACEGQDYGALRNAWSQHPDCEYVERGSTYETWDKVAKSQIQAEFSARQRNGETKVLFEVCPDSDTLIRSYNEARESGMQVEIFSTRRNRDHVSELQRSRVMRLHAACVGVDFNGDNRYWFRDDPLARSTGSVGRDGTLICDHPGLSSLPPRSHHRDNRSA